MGITNIFKSCLSIASEPQASWLFKVSFERNGLLFNSNDADIIAVKVDLPKFETRTITRHFLGTEKSFPIYKSYAGDSTLEFICRNGANSIMLYNSLKENEEYVHNEFKNYLSNFKVELYTRDGKLAATYFYKNVIITEANLGSVSYEDEAIVKLEVTIHYDSWTVKQERILTEDGEEDESV